MKVGDLVLTNYKDAIGKPHGVGVVVKVRERAGIGKTYHVRWACGAVMAHRKQWLIRLEENV